MQKQVSSLMFFALILLSLVVCLSGSVANPTPQTSYITINQVGNVEPQTDIIVREENIYRLTANITSYALKIQCSNIVFDGNGYYILGVEDEWSHPKWWPGNSGLIIENANRVQVQNLNVLRFYQGITLQNCSDCWVLRLETENLNLLQSNNNAITQNSFIDTSVPSSIHDSSNNLIYLNNFTIVGAVGANFWDNGSVGNYWIGYSGADSNGDGVGDTPYIISSGNIDNYPSMAPVTVKDEPAASQTPSLESQEEAIPTLPTIIQLYLIIVVIVLLVVAGVLSLIYFRTKTALTKKSRK